MVAKVTSKNQYGGIEVSSDAIASVAGNAVKECYGILGVASRSSLRENIFDLLKVEEYNRGIYARKGSKGYIVDVYVVCAYGVKLTEVVSEAQKKLKYVLEKTFKIPFSAVNVYVQDIKEI